MKKLILLLLIVNLVTLKAQEKDYNDWWNTGYWDPAPMKTPQKQSLIKVSGNKFINEDGKTILFRGLSISDPDKIAKQGHWNKEHFAEVKKMGANLVRIPVHPVSLHERTPFGYLELLKQAVDWCTELDLYVIIDWHSIGNLKTELFQAPMYNTTQKETLEFWRMIAKQFAGNNTVAFYEIFNEPTMFNGQLGKVTWSEWKQLVEKIIGVIRYSDTETIPLVAGFDWAYDLSYVKVDPINAINIAYVAHPYSFKRSQPWEPRWEENFAFVAEKYPIIATEIGFGFVQEDRGEVTEDNYGERIVSFLEERGISWMAWVFDPEWEPPMLKDWDYNLTEPGKFFKEKMKANKSQ